MSQLPEVTRLARQVLDRVVERVCGTCERNCCHQGTMMGSQDLRRLARAVALDPELVTRLREGLREKAVEVAADVAAGRRVLELLKASGLGSDEDLAAATKCVDDLEALAHLLATDFPLDYEHLLRLILHTALRHNMIRAFRAVEGGEGALARFADEHSSLHFRGRRLAPPRCIFHTLSLGCLAGRWKPAKCADFFCAADPSLLDALRDCMDFDDFVLAGFETVTMPWVLELLSVEARLGPEYHEPVVLVGLSDDDVQLLAAHLQQEDVPARVAHDGPTPLTASAMERLGLGVPRGQALLLVLPALSAGDLYEVAIGLGRLRQADEQRLLLLVPREYLTPCRPAHRLWAEHTISQPIGYLERYLVVAPSPPSTEEAKAREPAPGPADADTRAP